MCEYSKGFIYFNNNNIDMFMAPCIGYASSYYAYANRKVLSLPGELPPQFGGSKWGASSLGGNTISCHNIKELAQKQVNLQTEKFIYNFFLNIPQISYHGTPQNQPEKSGRETQFTGW